jgi:hypothetical protein
MSDKKTLATLRSERVTFLNRTNVPPPLRRNPYISHALYNAFNRLKRKPKETRRKTNTGARTANRGANLKRGSANRRATLNAKNKEKEKLKLRIQEEIQLKEARIKAKRERQREEAVSATAGATAEVNNSQESEVEQEVDAIAELTEMLAHLNTGININSNNRNAMKPWLRPNSNDE